FTAGKAGAYTILVEGRVWDTATSRAYGFTLHDSATTIQALDLGDGLGGPALGLGRIGNALTMTSHEELWIEDPALDLRQDITVEFWVNPDRATDTWTPLVYKANDAGQRAYTVWLRNNGLLHVSSMRGGSNDTLETPGGAVKFGEWSHVAAVIDRTTGEMKIYVNGELSASRAISTAQHNGSPDTPLYIGSTSEFDEGYRRLEGAIDEVRVWSGARTQGQIQAEMNAGAPSDATGLVSRLSFDNVAAGRTTPEAVSGAARL